MNDVRALIVNYYLTPTIETRIDSVSNSIKIHFKFINLTISCIIEQDAILRQLLALKKIQAIIELIDLNNKIETNFDKLPAVRVPIKIRVFEWGVDIDYLVIDFTNQTIYYNDNTIGNQIYTIMLTWLKTVLNQILTTNMELLVKNDIKDETKKKYILKIANKTNVLQFDSDDQTIYPCLYQLWLKNKN